VITEIYRDLSNGKIVKIGQSLDASGCKEVIDAEGLILFPGIVDLNVRPHDDLLSLDTLKKLYLSTQKAGLARFVLSPRMKPLIENQTFKRLLAGKLEKDFPNLK